MNAKQRLARRYIEQAAHIAAAVERDAQADRAAAHDHGGPGRVYIADAVHIEAWRDGIRLALSRGADRAHFHDPEWINQRTARDDALEARGHSLAAAKRAERAPSVASITRADGTTTIFRKRGAPLTRLPSVMGAGAVVRTFDVPIGEHTYRVQAARGYDAFKLAREQHCAAGHERPNAREWTARIVA